MLRLKKGAEGPTAALFEADGGAWKLAAVQAIEEFLALVAHRHDLTIIA